MIVIEELLSVNHILVFKMVYKEISSYETIIAGRQFDTSTLSYRCKIIDYIISVVFKTACQKISLNLVKLIPLWSTQGHVVFDPFVNVTVITLSKS